MAGEYVSLGQRKEKRRVEERRNKCVVNFFAEILPVDARNDTLTQVLQKVEKNQMVNTGDAC